MSAAASGHELGTFGARALDYQGSHPIILRCSVARCLHAHSVPSCPFIQGLLLPCAPCEQLPTHCILGAHTPAMQTSKLHSVAVGRSRLAVLSLPLAVRRLMRITTAACVSWPSSSPRTAAVLSAALAQTLVASPMLCMWLQTAQTRSPSAGQMPTPALMLRARVWRSTTCPWSS